MRYKYIGKPIDNGPITMRPGDVFEEVKDDEGFALVYNEETGLLESIHTLRKGDCEFSLYSGTLKERFVEMGDDDDEDQKA